MGGFMSEQAKIDASISLCSAWGLDATVISADNWDEKGYQTRERDGGQWRPWPEGFPVEVLVEIRGGFR